VASRQRLPAIGDYISGYPILDVLSWSTVSYIFKVRHRDTCVIRVMEMLSQEASQDDNLVRRFEREKEVMQSIGSNPGVVLMINHGYYSGYHYCIIEYVDGHDLGQTLTDAGQADFPLVFETAKGFAHVAAIDSSARDHPSGCQARQHLQRARWADHNWPISALLCGRKSRD